MRSPMAITDNSSALGRSIPAGARPPASLRSARSRSAASRGGSPPRCPAVPAAVRRRSGRSSRTSQGLVCRGVAAGTDADLQAQGRVRGEERARRRRAPRHCRCRRRGGSPRRRPRVASPAGRRRRAGAGAPARLPAGQDPGRRCSARAAASGPSVTLHPACRLESASRAGRAPTSVHGRRQLTGRTGTAAGGGQPVEVVERDRAADVQLVRTAGQPYAQTGGPSPGPTSGSHRAISCASGARLSRARPAGGSA